MNSIMFILFWLICLGFTAFFYLKTIEWQTISRLGFPSETPAAYIKKGWLYHYFCYALFVFCISCTFFISIWFAPLVVAVWLTVELRGRSKGIKIYRNILKELMDSSQDKLEVEKIKKELSKTDLEIWKLARNA